MKMKKKIAVIACSNACLDYIDHPYDIKTFRSALHLGDETYLDYVDISADDFYKRLEEDKSIFPRSSYYPVGKMVEMYEDLVKEGYTKAIVISISKKMSGIYNAAIMASNEVDALEVKVFDSKTLAYPEALMALEASKMIEEGKDFEEIFDTLNYIKENNRIYFAVNTLTYLVKNGRIGNASGFIGNALKIKPVLTIEDGEVDTVEKIRTFKKAVEKLIELYHAETRGKNALPFIIHANNAETSEYIKKRLMDADSRLKDVISLPLTAVVGAHAGPKTVGLGYYIKK
jgi:DegV family protein with EDD domain